MSKEHNDSIMQAIEALHDYVKSLQEGVSALNENDDLIKKNNLESKMRIEGIEQMKNEDIVTEYEKRYDQTEEMLSSYSLSVNNKKEIINTYKNKLNIISDLTSIVDDLNRINSDMNITESALDKAIEMNTNNLKVILNQLSEKIEYYSKDNASDLKKDVKADRVISLKDIEQNYTELIYSKIIYFREWSGQKFNSILYDSNVDDNNTETFRNKIMNHQHLYFIVIDENNSIFGHYHNDRITRIGNNYSDTMFMFSLSSYGKDVIAKYAGKKKGLFTYISYNQDFFTCSNSYAIGPINSNTSSIDSEVKDYFSNANKKLFVRSKMFKSSALFVAKRLIVIEMGENNTQAISKELISKQEMNEEMIYSHIPSLERKVNLKFSTLLYDSDIDGYGADVFKSKILNHKQVYILAMDGQNSIKGCYCPLEMKNSMKFKDNKMFMFSLKGQMVECIDDKEGKYMNIYDENHFFFDCGYNVTVQTNSSELKLTLLGGTQPGKTCLATRLTSGYFVEHFSATIGASYISKTLKIGGKEIKVSIWDTAGLYSKEYNE